MQPKPTSNFVTKSDVCLRALTRFLIPLFTRHETHIVMGIGILLLDLLTGPFLMFPVLFIIPVVLSAWYCSERLAYVLAVLLPFGRFLIAHFVESLGTITSNTVNALVRVAVLTLLAFLVARTARQNREIKILRGLFPICMFCKRIRNDDGSWEQLEAYISEHSEAGFSHGLCPECAQKHYGDLLDTTRNT